MARPVRGAGLALVLAGAALLIASASGLAGEAPDTSSARWGYQEAPGVVPPARGGGLPDGLICGRGHHQSPIALYTSGDHAARKIPILPVTFGYRPTPLHLVDNGRFVSVWCDSGSAVSLGGATSTLVRIDLHSPSEHTLDDTQYPLELEFVHRGDGGTPAMIVSVFVKAGQKNAALEPLLKAMPREGEESRPGGVTIDPGALLPQNHAYLDYIGSLTTPPCTEGVRWCVLRTPIEASQGQLDRYTSDPRLAHSSRPLSPGNERLVRMGSQP
jgi:carbonic anhydrase